MICTILHTIRTDLWSTLRHCVMVAQEILILFVIVRIYVSHQIIFMTDEVVKAKINQLKLNSSVRVEPIKKQKRGERIMLLIYETQQKLNNAKRKRKWYQCF